MPVRHEISKTKMKQAARDLHDIGVELIKMSEARLRAGKLPESVLAAVMAAKPLKMIALRRQKLFIGRLLREIGPDAQLARDLVKASNERARADAARSKRLAHWRDRLIAEGDTALEELVEVNPEVNRQQVRHLVRAAQKEATEDRPPAATRRLFRYLREAFQPVDAESDDDADGDDAETVADDWSNDGVDADDGDEANSSDTEWSDDES